MAAPPERRWERRHETNEMFFVTSWFSFGTEKTQAPKGRRKCAAAAQRRSGGRRHYRKKKGESSTTPKDSEEGNTTPNEYDGKQHHPKGAG